MALDGEDRTTDDGSSTGWTPDFIIDSPAGEDVLRSHAPLAASLVEVIRDGKARLIGVLGDWGSGKSTIMHMVEKELSSGTPPVPCFSFDAWKHQSDPQRRAFLENLIAAIEKEELFSDLQPSIAGWRERIDRLNRVREESEQKLTPKLNPWAAVFGFSLVLLPLSLKLIGDGTLSPEDANDAAAAGLFWAGWMGVALPILVAGHFFLRHRKAAEGSGVWALLANKPSETRAEVRIRDPEPSAIEFQSLFRDITEAAQSGGRRLLVIVDNLDRLPPEEAATVWAAVRALFLGADGSRSQGVDAPTIVMPLDPSAIEKLHKKADGQADPLAMRSFLEKTFDVVFHVPKPVLSRRHAYLRERLDIVFRKQLTADQLHDIGSVFERQIGELGETPGPRQINSFVNALAVLGMQRRNEPIALTVMAFFVARREETLDIRKCADDHGPYLATLHDDWRRALAALHFGVPLALAQELFIDEPLRDAIQRRDIADFAEFAAMEGFGRILLHNLDQALGAYVELQPLAAAELLAADHSSSPAYRAWIPDAWSKLRQLAVPVLSRTSLTQADLPGLAALLDSTPKPRRGGFAAQLALALGQSKGTLATADGVAAFVEAARLIDEATKGAGAAEVEIPVPNGFQGASAILVAGLPAKRLRRLTFQVDHDVWPRHLAERAVAPDKLAGPPIADVVHALGRRGPDIDWSALIEVLDNQMGDLTPGKARPVFETLFELATSSPRARKLLVARGRQPTYDVAFGGLWHEGGAKGLEEAIAFQLLTGGALLIAGETWEKRLESSVELVERVLARLLALGVDPDLSWLAQRLTAFPDERPLLGRLALIRFAGPTAPWAELFDKPEAALALLVEEDQPAFWTRVLDHTDVSQFLESWPPEISARIIEQAARHEPRIDVRPWAIAATGSRSAALWKETIETGAQPYALVTSIPWPGPKGEDLGTEAFKALTETVATVLATNSAPYRQRWFALEALMSPARRGGLRKRLVRALLETDLGSTQLLQLLPHLESSLSQSTYVLDRPDLATRHILAPLARDPAGRKWLASHQFYLTAWYGGSEEATRQIVRGAIQRAAQNGDRSSRALLVLLRDQAARATG